MGLFSSQGNDESYLQEARSMDPKDLCIALKSNQSIIRVNRYNCICRVLEEKAEQMDDDELIELYEYAEGFHLSSGRNLLLKVLRRRGLISNNYDEC